MLVSLVCDLRRRACAPARTPELMDSPTMPGPRAVPACILVPGDWGVPLKSRPICFFQRR